MYVVVEVVTDVNASSSLASSPRNVSSKIADGSLCISDFSEVILTPGVSLPRLIQHAKQPSKGTG